MNAKVYPSWRYHKTELAKIIHSHEEHEALGDDWAQSPAAFEEVAAKDVEQDGPSDPLESLPAGTPDGLGERSEAQLAQMAAELGHSKKKLKGKTKA